MSHVKIVLEMGYHAAMKAAATELLRESLKIAGGSRTRAAQLLGLNRTYFLKLLKQHGVEDSR
jgi:DNA-binding protein Fis